MNVISHGFKNRVVFFFKSLKALLSILLIRMFLLDQASCVAIVHVGFLGI